MRTLTALVSAALLSAISSGMPIHAKGAAQFPKELLGEWNPMPYDCLSKDKSENDMRFSISGRNRNNFEDIESVRTAALISSSPRAWRIDSISNVVGNEADPIRRIYVLGPKYLFISDGNRADQFVRCL